MDNYIKKFVLCSLVITMIMASSSQIFADGETYNITNNYYQNGIPGGIYPGADVNYNQGVYYYIMGYDRIATTFYNGEAMCTRLPVIGGNNYTLVNIANGLVRPAYNSIKNWCEDNLNYTNMQDFYLNSAAIESQTAYSITMTVNCAIKRKGILNGNIEFNLVLDLSNNRYHWNKVDYTSKKSYDLDGATVIIVP